jgi:hypothetical protein
MNEIDVLKGPFDLETHKKTFANYFEAVIAPNGTVLYACPSHLEVLERLYCLRTGRDAMDDVPRERWLDVLDWLMEQTGCICAWTGGTMGRIGTMEQEETVRMLERECLIRR